MIKQIIIETAISMFVFALTIVIIYGLFALIVHVLTNIFRYFADKFEKDYYTQMECGPTERYKINF